MAQQVQKIGSTRTSVAGRRRHHPRRWARSCRLAVHGSSEVEMRRALSLTDGGTD